MITAAIILLVGYVVWQQEAAALKECAPNCTMLLGDMNVLDQHIPIEYKCVPYDPANASLLCPPAPACILNERPEPDLPLFMQEARSVAGAHYYETGRYVCQHYAKELTRRLQADGYHAQYCIGKALWCNEEDDSYNCWHAWVKLGDGIYIEATTGQFIEPKDYGRDYEERSCSSGLPD